MVYIRNTVCLGLFLAAVISAAFAQKVQVGFDKSTDFSKYKTYTWAAPTRTPSRPLLYEMVVQAVDYELKNKGLQRTDKNGDLFLAAGGGTAFGLSVATAMPILPTYSSPPTFAPGTIPTAASYVTDGTLQLQFVDPQTNTVVWNGSVSTRIEMDRKKESMDRINKGITKLLMKFPPSK